MDRRWRPWWRMGGGRTRAIGGSGPRASRISENRDMATWCENQSKTWLLDRKVGVVTSFYGLKRIKVM
jgi:hypothetical protein